jgi:WD40 repeat protein
VVRDFPNPDLKPVFEGEPAPSHPGWVHAVRFTPDGGRLVTAGAAPRARAYLAVWNVADGKRLSGGERDWGPIHALALFPDGTRNRSRARRVAARQARRRRADPEVPGEVNFLL